MNIPTKGLSGSRRPSTASGASNDSTYTQNKTIAPKTYNTYEIPTCDPQPFLSVVIDTPSSTSCPPFFVFNTSLESRIAPAHVPQTGFRDTNSLRGSNKPARRASSAIVVDSDAFREPEIVYKVQRISS